MEDPAAVREPKRIEHLQQDPEVPREQIRDPEPALHLGGVAEQRAPLDALDPLQHDQRLPAVVEREVVDRDHVGVLERSGDPRLAQEIERRRRCASARLERLDRHRATERDLLGGPDHAHPALGDHVADPQMHRARQRPTGQLLEHRQRTLAARARQLGLVARGGHDRLVGGGRERRHGVGRERREPRLSIAHEARPVGGRGFGRDAES